MGANMARRLADQNETVAVVYDRNSETAKNLAQELSCDAAATLGEVTEKADIIFTVVSDDAAMEQLFSTAAGEDSLLTGSTGRLFINCATITPRVHVEIAERAHHHGAQTLEACMASSIPQARAGTLYLMVGGAEETYRRAEPLLKKLAGSMRYIGAAGRAAQVKALVNMVMNMNTAALAEGLGLADALDLDLDIVMEVFSQTGANSRVLETDGEDMKNRDHEVYFSAAHAAKDSGIAQVLGNEAGLNLPLNDAATAQFQKMVDLGLGDLDKSGVAELTFRGRTGPQ